MRISSLPYLLLFACSLAVAQVPAQIEPGPATGEGSYSQPLLTPNSAATPVNVPSGWQNQANTYGAAAAAQSGALNQMAAQQAALAAQQQAALAGQGGLNFNIQAPAATATQNSGGLGSMMSMLPAVIQACPLFNGTSGDSMGSTPKNEQNMMIGRDVGYMVRDKMGYQKAIGYDDGEAATYGKYFSAKHGAKCKSFIDAKGNVDGWGDQVLEHVKQRPDLYGNNIPDDMSKYCPGYVKWSGDPKKVREKRELFWVWFAATVSNHESSCNPAAKNDTTAPNVHKIASDGLPVGPAAGLFGVDRVTCKGVGVTGSLFNPHTNIDCFMKKIDKEFSLRDTMMSTTSSGRSKEATTFGTLRVDDSNPNRRRARGGMADIRASQKVRAELGQFEGCRG